VRLTETTAQRRESLGVVAAERLTGHGAGRYYRASETAIRKTSCVMRIGADSGGVCYRHHMSDDDVKTELERLKAENERLKRLQDRRAIIKVSEKGGVSVYGLGRFPVTLYQEQWTKLLDMADEIRAFIREHQGELKVKER
jgi:hypothetical protein